MESTEKNTKRFPLMALRGITVFPRMSMSFDVERKASVAAVEAASNEGRRIFLVTQRDVLVEEPDDRDLYKMGTICVLKQFIRTPDGVRVMVEGLCRARLEETFRFGDLVYAEVTELPETAQEARGARAQGLLRNAVSLFEEYLEIAGNPSPETLISLTMRNEPGYTADYIAQNAALKYTEKQQVLETVDRTKRLRAVCALLAREVEVLGIEKELNEKVYGSMIRDQKNNVLREQMRVIQSELGEDDVSETDEYRAKIRALKLQPEIEDKLLKETDRLAKQPFGSAEGAVLRGYLDTCLELPWNKTTKERNDIAEARRILDRDHYGLDKVKERVIEFLAVRQLAPDVKGGILCLVGPPGVGKTSIAYSIARATNRKMARMSLGGVHDEAEIRGHRKTYIGAMPGRIIAAVKQAGSMNPVILLDEIDKLADDYHGSPASALLEALDPEQNTTFRDHYLEMPFDLSRVLFITTANNPDTIPPALLDRMEVIDVPSYTDEEKLQIARRHLLPKQRKKHGLDGRMLRVSDNVIREIIAGWTRESGVRQLERELAALCRKTAAVVAEKTADSVTVKAGELEKWLGVRRYKPETMTGRDEVGLVHGLAWTAVGGELLNVEAIAVDGSGKLELTGNLGDVMKESARTAVSYIRSRCDVLGVDKDFYKTKDIHLHFPEGAVPKDGPSAGITITVAVVSALTGAPVRSDVAMTGEIMLNGRIIPIGGLKEKTMAALRYGMKTVVIPAENASDLAEIDQTVRAALDFVLVSSADEVFDLVMDLPEKQQAEPEKKREKRRAAAKSAAPAPMRQ